LLVEDNAGWHRSKKAKIPDGISVQFLPAYSPELQPAERLWTLVDEPLAGLRQISSPNQAQSSFVSHEYVPIVVQPLDKTERHRCAKRL
jgi:hypothetical protein